MKYNDDENDDYSQQITKKNQLIVEKKYKFNFNLIWLD